MLSQDCATTYVDFFQNHICYSIRLSSNCKMELYILVVKPEVYNPNRNILTTHLKLQRSVCKDFSMSERAWKDE